MKHLLAFILLIGSLTNVSGQWTQCQTLTGGSIITDIIQFNGKMFVAVDKSGLFKSADNGDTWERLDIPYQGNFVHFLQHNTELLAVSFGAQFRTSDGDQWTSESGPPAFINDLASDGVNIFAATHLGVYVSADAGAHWQLAADVATQVTMASVTANASVVWVSADSPNGGVLFKSENGGASWIKVVKGTDKLSDLYVLGTTLYANSSYDAVYKTPDGGATWQAIHTNLGFGLLFGTPNGLFHFTNFQVSVSTNNGLSWTVSTQSSPAYNVQCIYATANNFFVGFWGGGVYRNDATGSATWLSANSGLAVTEIHDIEVTPNTIFIGTDYSFIHSSHDEATSWEQLYDVYHLPSGSAWNVLSTGSDLYVGQGGGGIQRSVDGGATWVTKNDGLSDQIIWALAATHTGLFAATGDGVFRSTNRGDTWIKKSDGVMSIRTLYADGDIIYAGTYSGLFRSEDNGDSWTRISTGLPDESVGSIVKLGSTLFVATQFNGLYKTSNLGGLWEPVLNYYVQCLVAGNGRLFLGSLDGKVLVSTDQGVNWTDISIGLPVSQISTIGLTAEHVLAGTTVGHGLWLRTLVEVAPPAFTFYSSNETYLFYPGDPIFVSSDQELRTPAGGILLSADLTSYITVKDSHGQGVTYAAEINDNKKIITITIDNAIVGEAYSVTIAPLKNTFGLTSPETESDIFTAINNLPPVLSNISVSGPENQTIAFSVNDFSNAFSDDDLDNLVRIQVKELPQHGTLLLSGSPVTINSEIPVASLGQLTYTPETNYSGNDHWKWNGSDGKDYAALDVTVNIAVTAVTGLEILAQDGIEISPNPVSGILKIAFLRGADDPRSVGLHDLAGRQVVHLQLEGMATRTASLDLSDFPAGLYILTVNHAGPPLRVRIIKR